jgi:glucan phosphoethanolaminetransferase (alkaline phosphatase superfamily)
METENTISQDELVRMLSTPLYNNKGWIKFFGIMNILYGLMAAVTLVGLIFAWLPIWLGVLINGAANKIEQAHIIGDRQAMMEAQQKLSTYFLIQAILVLVALAGLAVFVVIALSTGFYSHMWQEMRSQGIY